MGFRPPGAPSKNPATARKAEKKKRGARTVRKGDVPAGNLLDDLCACVRHQRCINGDERKGKRPIAIIENVATAATLSP